MYHIIVYIVLFLRIRSEELNDMGYCLSRISPITFNKDAFQMPNNKAKDRAQHLHLERGKMRPMVDLPHRHHNRMVTTNCTVQIPVQMSQLAGLCLHNQITLVVPHRGWTAQTQQQCIMGSQMGNIKASVPVYKHHQGTPYPQEMLTPPRQQIKRFYRLMEPKPHLLHPPGSLQ